MGKSFTFFEMLYKFIITFLVLTLLIHFIGCFITLQFVWLFGQEFRVFLTITFVTSLMIRVINESF